MCCFVAAYIQFLLVVVHIYIRMPVYLLNEDFSKPRDEIFNIL